MQRRRDIEMVINKVIIRSFGKDDACPEKIHAEARLHGEIAKTMLHHKITAPILVPIVIVVTHH